MTSNDYNDPFDDFCPSKIDLTMLLKYLLNFYLGNTLFNIRNSLTDNLTYFNYLAS
jgi:hypothetical protein